MNMLSVEAAAAQLGVSPSRVRQRIQSGSLVAERVGGHWVVDLSVVPDDAPPGRPVGPDVIWDALRRVAAARHLREVDGIALEEALRLAFARADLASLPVSDVVPDLVLPDGRLVELKVGRSSRRRALDRVIEALGAPDRPDSSVEGFLVWLRRRAERRVYRIGAPDLQDLRADARLLLSGLAHPSSRMQDARVVEGYVTVEDLPHLEDDYWLEPPRVGRGPNVYLHVAPGRPAVVSPLMLAADLFEHGGARERARADELVAEASR